MRLLSDLTAGIEWRVTLIDYDPALLMRGAMMNNLSEQERESYLQSIPKEERIHDEASCLRDHHPTAMLMILSVTSSGCM